LSGLLWPNPEYSKGFHPTSAFGFEDDHWNCPLLLDSYLVPILYIAITMATSCGAMSAGKGSGHVCGAAGYMWGVGGKPSFLLRKCDDSWDPKTE